MNTKRPSVLHLHFWADIRNSAGSVEKVISAFASNGRRYQHMIACCPADRTVRAPFEHLGVPTYPVHENRIANRIFNKTFRLGAFTYQEMARTINRLRPDVLHVHNRQELVDPLIRRLAYKPAVLVHYHRHFAQPTVPASADRLIFISQRTADDILAKTRVARPYDIIFNPLSQQVLARIKDVGFRAPGTPRVILFGGGGNPIKGGEELIKAFAQLPLGSCRLQLAGRNVARLHGLPAPGIEVLGEVPADPFFDLMLSADIVAMPSYDEPFGLIAQEAMLLRKLLVVAGSGGLTEFTGPDCAIVIRPKDVASLAAGLRSALSLLDDSAATTALLDRARERAAAFAADALVEKLETAYDAARIDS